MSQKNPKNLSQTSFLNLRKKMFAKSGVFPNDSAKRFPSEKRPNRPNVRPTTFPADALCRSSASARSFKGSADGRIGKVRTLGALKKKKRSDCCL
jgi:hypothetical protein